jgi:flagellar biosynthetic protein FlhB
VPEALFEAVAVVIAYIFNLNSINRSSPEASVPQPQIPDDMLFDSDGNRTSIIDV